MKIICSTNIPFAGEAFRTLGEVEILNPPCITAEKARDADAMVTRSTIKVNRALLEGSRVKFVGTTTIGTDHMDLEYLQKAGIAWCSAPGCNANSVSEYIIAALLCLARRYDYLLEGRTIGVIGIGNVGGLVARKAQALGMRVLRNDPPLRDASGDSIYLPLEEVLSSSDIITLHVPLTRAGKHPTFHLADEKFFERAKNDLVFINSSRGAAMNSNALLAALEKHKVAHAVIDTWENEPAFSSAVLDKVDLGTPHIAGHSFEGKVNGTVMVYRELCRFLKSDPAWSPDALLPRPIVPLVDMNAAGRSDEDVIGEVVKRVYDIEADDRALREAALNDPKQRAKQFEQLRENYPVHREFRFTQVVLENGRPGLSRKLLGLGFAVVSNPK